jgi:ArsR family transcriptional regulator, arsenate/arsenite/antimonite-responsive transcriptional repressor
MRCAHDPEVQKVADMLAAIGTEPRLRIMQLLLAAQPGGLTPGAVAATLNMPASTLSHHLEKLKNEDLVTVTREHQFLWYAANASALRSLLSFLFAECCTRSNAVDPVTIASANPDQTLPGNLESDI